MASQRQPSQLSKDAKADLLEAVMRRHRLTFIRQAGFHAGSSADAEDAVSDACIQFLGHFHGRDDREALLWMQTVVKRCAWRIAEARRRRVLRVEPELPADLADESRGPAQLAEAAETVRRFNALFARLKPDERRALLLIASGHTYVEVGQTLGWTLTKVNRCAAEGRARLRGFLATEGEKL